MAFHRFIKGIMQHEPIPIYGDGLQTRDFTYIQDCVEATVAALDAQGVIGEIINIGGFEKASILEVISMLEYLLKQKATLEFTSRQNGDPLDSWADISKAQRLLNYDPECPLQEGLRHQIIDTHRNHLSL
jgi:nucleoside-diphosphate-sugar epimerase